MSTTPNPEYLVRLARSLGLPLTSITLHRLAERAWPEVAPSILAMIAGDAVDLLSDRATMLLEEPGERTRRRRSLGVGGLDGPETGAVYVLASSELPDRCKIGFALDVLSRVRTLQVGSPVVLDRVQAWPSDRVEEYACHNLCGDLWIRGEWFRIEACARIVQHFELAGRPRLFVPLDPEDASWP